MEGVLERIRELEGLVALARETDADVRDRQTSLRATDDQLRSQIEEIQEMIKAGQSSGDPALDIIIMLGDTVVKDKTYQRLAWLQYSLASKPGELVCVEQSLGRWKLAIIPSNVRIGWDNSFDRKRGHVSDVVIPVERFLTRERAAIPADVSQPIGIYYKAFTELFHKVPTDEVPEISHDLKFHIGNKKVQAWAQGLRPDEVLTVTAACRALGKPLQVWPELSLLIRNKREAEIPWLLNQMAELKYHLDTLRSWQREPANFLKGHRGGIEATEEGVTIDFGLGREIREVKSRLRGRIHVAVVLLEMGDNPTLQEAAKLVDYELPE